MKKMEFIVFSSLVALSVSAAPITISVSGTANQSKMGYTVGNLYTFTWVVSDTYVGGSGSFDDFQNTYTIWNTSSTNDPTLFSSFSGDLLTGTYIRPTGALNAPYESIFVLDSEFELLIQNDAAAVSGMGITVDNKEIFSIEAHELMIGQPVTYSGVAIDPAVWLVDYIGSFNQSEPARIVITDVDEQSLIFNATNVTIIPEPTTALLMAAGGVLACVLRFKQH